MATLHTEQQPVTSQLSQAESSAQPQPTLHQSSIVSRPLRLPGPGLQYSGLHPSITVPPGGRGVQHHIYHHIVTTMGQQGALGAGMAAPLRQCNPGSNPQGIMVMAPTATTACQEDDEDKTESSKRKLRQSSKRKLRLDSNRESARKSRQKKKEYVDQLKNNIDTLEAENKQLKQKMYHLENFCKEFNIRFTDDVPRPSGQRPHLWAGTGGTLV